MSETDVTPRSSRFIALDDAIVASIADGACTSNMLVARHEAAALAAAMPLFGDRNGWRVIDRRLQALRKAGRITFTFKAGWTALASAPRNAAPFAASRALKHPTSDVETIAALPLHESKP